MRFRDAAPIWAREESVRLFIMAVDPFEIFFKFFDCKLPSSSLLQTIVKKPLKKGFIKFGKLGKGFTFAPAIKHKFIYIKKD
jgi:hypothetical protein